MDSRARIAFSGLAAFAVSATVVATVVTTNAAAFADAPGAAIDAAVVDVKTTAAPAGAPQTTSEPAMAAPSEPSVGANVDVAPVQPETVPAPAPAVVPPVTTAATPEPAPTSDVQMSFREAIASDDPQAVYAWAAAHGWSKDDVDRLLPARHGVRSNDARDSGKRDDHRQNDRGAADGHPRFTSPNPPVQTGSPAVTESPQRGDGMKRDRSPGSPDHRD